MINVLDVSSMMKAEASHLSDDLLYKLSYGQHRRRRERDVYSMMSWNTSVLCWPEDTTKALEPDRRMGWVWEHTIKMTRTWGLTHFLIFMRNTNNTTKWNMSLTKIAMVQQYHRAAAFPKGLRLKSGLNHVSIPFQMYLQYISRVIKISYPHPIIISI